jgi:hypothetical protein
MKVKMERTQIWQLADEPKAVGPRDVQLRFRQRPRCQNLT